MPEHRREMMKCWLLLTKVLVVGLFIALNVEEGIAVPHLGLPRPAQGDGGGLAVPDQHVPGAVHQVGRAGQPVRPPVPWSPWVALEMQG